MELDLHFVSKSSLSEFISKVGSNVNQKIPVVKRTFVPPITRLTEHHSLLYAIVSSFSNIREGREKVIYLLENGADPNQYEKDHDEDIYHTSVWEASFHGIPLLELFITHKGDINKLQRINCLPIYQLFLRPFGWVEEEHFEMFHFLLNNGAKLEIPEKNVFLSDNISMQTHPFFIEGLRKYENVLSEKSVLKLKEIRLQQLF